MLSRVLKGFCKAASNFVSTDIKGAGYSLTQFSQKSLAIYSYLLLSNGQAALIDPIIDPSAYLAQAELKKCKITHIFLSHFHADYLAASRLPSVKTVAFGEKGPNGVYQDGSQIAVGSVKLKLLHTPGHTMQSSCYLLYDSANKESSLFTGDTLFLNQVGRPDLAVKTNEITAEMLAQKLFESLQKIKKLPDHLTIFPGHGKGSACGKSIGDGAYCTLGVQKGKNYGLMTQSKEEFVSKVLKGMPNPPSYFFNTARQNIAKTALYDALLKQSKKKCDSIADGWTIVLISKGDSPLGQTAKLNGKPAIVLSHNEMLQFHASALVPTDRPIVIAGPQDLVASATQRLILMGYDNIQGNYPTSNVDREPIAGVNAEQAKALKGIAILDVRTPEQIQNTSLPNSIKVEYNRLRHVLEAGQFSLPKGAKLLVHCRSGNRASGASALLRRHGFEASPIVDKLQNVISHLK